MGSEAEGGGTAAIDGKAGVMIQAAAIPRQHAGCHRLGLEKALA